MASAWRNSSGTRSAIGGETAALFNVNWQAAKMAGGEIGGGMA